MLRLVAGAQCCHGRVPGFVVVVVAPMGGWRPVLPVMRSWFRYLRWSPWRLAPIFAVDELLSLLLVLAEAGLWLGPGHGLKESLAFSQTVLAVIS